MDGLIRRLAERTQPTGRNRQLSRWLAERTRRADRSPFVRSTRPPAPVCPGKPDQAHRHDLAKRTQYTKQDDVTSPIAQIRQEKPPRGPAVSWPNEPERPPRWRVGRNVRLGRTNPEPRHARRLYLLPLGSIRVLAFRLKILLYFSCCLQGGLFLHSLRLCSLSGSQSAVGRKKAVSRKKSRGSQLTQTCLAGRTQGGSPVSIWTKRSQGGNPVTPVAKQTQEAPNDDFGQTNPSCRPVRASSPTNPRPTEPLVFPPNEPKVQPGAGLS